MYNYKLCWNVFSRLRRFILDTNGIIFGGYVRDMIIHDHYSQTYYEYVKISGTKNDEYMNGTFHHESWPMRIHQPMNLDVAFTTDQYQMFLNMLKHNNICVCVMTNVNDMDCTYATTLALHAMNSETLYVCDRGFTVRIDVIFKDAFEPKDTLPLGTIDFECNSLLLTKSGIDLQDDTLINPYNKFTKLSRIIKDIINKIAIPVQPQGYRVAKMIEKGFGIKDDYIEIFPKNVHHDESCIMCCYKFEHDDIIIKNTCCNARYHLDCYQQVCMKAQNQYNNIHYCVMCRQKISHEHFTDFDKYIRKCDNF